MYIFILYIDDQDLYILPNGDLFKGRHCCRCFLPSKPNKWFFKIYCLDDADSGYLSNFFMYGRNGGRRPADMPAILFLILLKTQKNVDGW